jgi:C4-dicarboxylate-specific signal transduction histidine kinase
VPRQTSKPGAGTPSAPATTSPADHPASPGGGAPKPRSLPVVSPLLAGMRIRKKLIFLHTLFSLLLAGALWLALRPAVGEVVKQAEVHEASVLVSVLQTERRREVAPGVRVGDGALPALRDALGPGVEARAGTAEELGLTPAQAAEVRTGASARVVGQDSGGRWFVAAFDPDDGRFISVSVVLEGARSAVVRLYVLMLAALLAVYALVAAALELFVLPQHVYVPIRRMLSADLAVQEGRRERELIPAGDMPADELGEIMRSRNESILALRRHESDLGRAMASLEHLAADLKKKNDLLELAQRNLADADRLASLGVMSAGIAHELNTPLAVLKGLVEKQQRAIGERLGAPGLSEPEAALMVRVVGRLERLSESLLDFARVRPPTSTPTLLAPLVEEAWTLVRLDRRESSGVAFGVRVPAGLAAMCDGDRIVQVLVNLLRNAVDALDGGGKLEVVGEQTADGSAVLRVVDSGPGISPEVFERLFQPFASTRLDAKGTGLGLAVAEGIVREHGGVLVARNRTDGSTGAEFEITLPGAAPASTPTGPVSSGAPREAADP